MVIGIVAVLTIPALMQQINKETLKGQRISAGSKLAKGFHQMRVEGILEEKHENTAAFVEQMKKYFKIAQICDSNNLTNCFSSSVSTEITEDEQTTLKTNNIDEINDKKNTMGIKFSDGTNMLIRYNPESALAGSMWSNKIIDEERIGQLSGKDSYPTYSDLFYYVIDVNSEKAPNTKGKDVVGNLVLEKTDGTDVGLDFVFIDDTAFSTGCGSIECVEAFCREKGGRVPTHADIMAIADALFDKRGYAYYLKEGYNPDLFRIFSSTDGVTQTGAPYGEYCINTYLLSECTVGGTWCNFDPDGCGAYTGYLQSTTFCIK